MNLALRLVGGFGLMVFWLGVVGVGTFGLHFVGGWMLKWIWHYDPGSFAVSGPIKWAVGAGFALLGLIPYGLSHTETARLFAERWARRLHHARPIPLGDLTKKLQHEPDRVKKFIDYRGR